MSASRIQHAEFSEGYRLITVGGSLFIEAIRDHPAPLRLRTGDLSRLGLGPWGFHNAHGTTAVGNDEGIAALWRRYRLWILLAALAMLILAPSVVSGW